LLSIDNTDGTFNYHESIPEYKLDLKIIDWIKINLKNYTGCLNLEIIDNNIIEAHLRLNGDFYLYNKDFVLELEKLYTKKQWNLNYKIKKTYLVPIFVTSNLDINNIKFDKILKLLKKYGAKSLRINNINSIHQKEGLSRLFMYDIYDIKKGLKLKKQILNILV
jgi:hypothetical protein